LKYKIRTNSLEATRRLLSRVADILMTDTTLEAVDIQRYRAVVYCASTLIQCLERSDLEKRICRLEEKIEELIQDD